MFIVLFPETILYRKAQFGNLNCEIQEILLETAATSPIFTFFQAVSGFCPKKVLALFRVRYF